MNQPWSGSTSFHDPSRAAWRLPSESGAQVEPLKVDNVLKGESSGRGDEKAEGLSSGGSGYGANQQHPSKDQSKGDSSQLWESEDFKSYVAATSGRSSDPSGDAARMRTNKALTLSKPNSSPGKLPGTESSMNASRRARLVGEQLPSRQAESQALAQAALGALWRTVDKFPGDAFSRGDLQASLSHGKVPAADRAVVQRLLEDPVAFDFLDRLDQNRDGRISREMLANYAPDAAGAPLGSAAAGNAPADPATGFGASARPAPTALASTTSPWGMTLSESAEGSESLTTPPGAAPEPVAPLIERNFGVLDAAAPGSKFDGLVTMADITSAAGSGLLSPNARAGLSNFALDPTQFSKFDALDGATDGNIAWSSIAQGGGNPEIGVIRGPKPLNPLAGQYSDEFFALIHEIVSAPANVGADGAGGVTAPSMSKSVSALGKAFAADPLAFKQIDSFDGVVDGVARLSEVRKMLNPSDLLFSLTVPGKGGQPVPVVQSAFTALGNDYLGAPVPPLPPGVNNDGERSFRMAFAVQDNFAKIAASAQTPAANAAAAKVSSSDLIRASENPEITAEDRVLLRQLADDTATFDWLARAADTQGGAVSTALTASGVQSVVSAWNKANYNTLMEAHAAIVNGLDSLAAKPEDGTGFKTGMGMSFINEKVFDPGAVQKAYQRMISDPAISADLRAKVATLVPDAANLAQGMAARLTSPLYLGYLGWVNKTQGDAAQLRNTVSGQLYALSLIDPQSAATAGEEVSRQMVSQQLETMAANANPALVRQALSDILTEYLRGARSGARLAGNVLYYLNDLQKIPKDWNRLIDMLVPEVLHPGTGQTTAYLDEPGRLSQVGRELMKSGLPATIGSVFGFVLAGYQLNHRANDSLPSTPHERLADALVLVAPFSYGNQIVKTVNYLLEGSGINTLSTYNKLASEPLSMLLTMDSQGRDGGGRQIIDPSRINSFNRSMATLSKAAIPGLDMAGGVLAAVLGGIEMADGRKAGDMAQVASGALLTAGGSIWAGGGLASLFFSALSSPFFVASGAAALAGLLVGMFKDPGKQFAQTFTENFGRLEAIGGFRQNWRDDVAAWYRENYFDKSAHGSGIGLEM